MQVVLSLFDGISCGKVAIERLGLKVNKDFKYYAAEIDKSAIKCSKDNHPEIVRLGDVTKISYKAPGIFSYEDLDTKVLKTINVGKIDLLIGGSPCVSFSSLGPQTGLKGASGIFFEYLRLLDEIRVVNKDVIFLLENVRMKKESKKELDTYLGTVGVPINSSLVSYQQRNRIYWSNKPFTVPADRNINFQDYIEKSVPKSKVLPRNKSTLKMWNGGAGNNSIAGGCANVTKAKKIYCLTTKQYRCPNSGIVEFEGFFRFLTTAELEQAQNLPIGYTKVLTTNQAEAVLGNGWTVNVISHILKDILSPLKKDVQNA